MGVGVSVPGKDKLGVAGQLREKIESAIELFVGVPVRSWCGGEKRSAPSAESKRSVNCRSVQETFRIWRTDLRRKHVVRARCLRVDRIV